MFHLLVISEERRQHREFLEGSTLFRDVREYCQSCESCQLTGGEEQKSTAYPTKSSWKTVSDDS